MPLRRTILGMSIFLCLLLVFAAFRISTNQKRRNSIREIWKLKVQTSLDQKPVMHPRGAKDWYTMNLSGLSGAWGDLVGVEPPTTAWVQERHDLVVDSQWLRELIVAIKQIPEIRTIMVRRTVLSEAMLEELRSNLPEVSVTVLDGIPRRSWTPRP